MDMPVFALTKLSGYLNHNHNTLRQTATNQQNRPQPASANKVQWQQIQRAIDYGKSRGVKVIVTGVK